uniref:Glycosyltransferase 2-like domain-containing protein n=1 Tax=viral metagenome TaxID=1070528 RepID=A0A6C0D108_9ZZZZ
MSSIHEWKYKEREIPLPRSYSQLCIIYLLGIVKVTSISLLFLLIMSTLIGYHHTMWTGVVVILYFINQCLSSFSNKAFYAKTSNQEEIITNEIQNVGIVIVGYRENPDYFEKCMNSLRLYASEFVNAIVLVVDGEEEEDQYMIDIAKNEWIKRTMSTVITPITPLYPILDSEPNDAFTTITLENENGNSTSTSLPQKPALHVFLRPHQGKRATMAYGIDYIKTAYPSNREIIVMDSDTFLRKESIPNLVMGFRTDEKNGCMTGSIEIFNKNYCLPRIVNARYGYAFSIERGAMSWYGCMNCCSGPFSIYRQDLFTDQLLSDFIGQTCGKDLVGPGDDRHLTNLVMMAGYKSRQNPYAIAWTETPKYLFRYLQQQTRWSRSFYREQVFQIFATTHQNIFLSCVTVWELFFPFFIIIGFFPYFNPSIVIYFHRIMIAILVSILRTIILIVFYEGDCSYWNNVFIFFMYFLLLLPIKVYALFTCCLQQWITSSRKSIATILSPDILGMCVSLLLWYSMLISSIYAKSTDYYDQSKNITWEQLFKISF